MFQSIKAVKIILIYICCLTIFLGLFSSNGCIIGKAATETETVGITYNKNSYVAYRETHSDKQKPNEEIKLLGTGFSAMSSDEIICDTIVSKECVSWTTDSGWVEWEFDVQAEGMYNMKFLYYALEGKGGDIEYQILIDGRLPFEEVDNIALPRIFEDEKLQFNENGNQYRSEQIERFEWQSRVLYDTEGFISDPLFFYLSEGIHTLRLTAVREYAAIESITFFNEPKTVNYAQYISTTPNNDISGVAPIVLEAEECFTKSSRMLSPISDRADASTTPSNPLYKRYNTIGGENWSTPNREITWLFDIKKDGYYNISFRYKQNFIRGFSVTRRMTIDGQVLFDELNNVTFPYSNSWQTKILGDEEPFKIYLTKGEHTITLIPSIGDMEETVNKINYVVSELNNLYREVIKITGNDPDFYRDYALQTTVPNLIEILEEQLKTLQDTKEYLDKKNNTKGSEAEVLSIMSEQVKSFIKRPSSIPSRISTFQTNISSLAAWCLDMRNQSLLLDKLAISSDVNEIPEFEVGFFEKIKYHINAFLGSFIVDYSNVGEFSDEYQSSIKVWVNGGRDQAEVLRTLVDSDFSPNHKINVNIAVVQGSLVQAAMAGLEPDAVVMLGHGDPVNFALRGIAAPLDGYEGFEQLKSEFMATAFNPYYLQGHCYGIPETQLFHVMFCRDDILKQYGVEVPETWTDLYVAAEKLQRNHMNIGLPYVSMDAYSVISQGMGGQTIFPTLLIQSDNGIYNKELTATTLNTEEALEAFNMWTGFYKQYGFPVYKDDFNRFRTGEMPIIIANYTFYNQLSAAAPELRGNWSMNLVPGTVREDGTINHSEAASGSAAMMLSSSKEKDSAWKFIRWWCQAKTQSDYGLEIENIFGVAGRYNPANIEAMSKLPWSSTEYDLISEQWELVVELPEVAGGYYTSRNIDNAFKAVIYNNSNSREELHYWNKETNAEIQRKREEYGLN